MSWIDFLTGGITDIFRQNKFDPYKQQSPTYYQYGQNQYPNQSTGLYGQAYWDNMFNEAQRPQPQTQQKLPLPEFASRGLYNQLPTPAFDAYRAYIDKMPQRAQYPPGIWDRILAGTTGFATGYTQGPARGVAATKAMLEMKYNDALSDWTNKLDPLRYAAMTESQNTGRENAYLANIIRNNLGYANIEQKDRATQAGIERAKIMAQSWIDRAKIPNWKYLGESQDSNNPGVLMFNTKTGEEQVLPYNIWSRQEDAQAAMERLRFSQGQANWRALLVDNRTRATTQARIDAAYERQTRDLEARVGRENAALILLQRQDTLARLYKDLPNVIGQTTSGNFVPIGPDMDPGFFDEDFRPEWDRLMSSLPPIPTGVNRTLPGTINRPSTTIVPGRQGANRGTVGGISTPSRQIQTPQNQSGQVITLDDGTKVTVRR